MSFDLSSLLKDVSNLDTGREQIEYIPLELIKEDPNNFYLLSGVEDLAANISLCGLQQPIRVRKHPTEEGKYMIVSGHRRRAAVSLLAQEDPARWQEVPCIIEQDEVSPALQQLRLIYANSNTRTMTSAEQGEQVEQVTKLLYQLKEEGYDFPGRMRDHVAEAVNISKTKLARLKVIREKLAGCWKPAYRSEVIKEATAYALAQLPKDWQELIYKVHKDKPHFVYQSTVENAASRMERVSGMECTHGCIQGCMNLPAMLERNIKETYNYCTGCCFDCGNLRTCKSSCSMAALKKKELRDVEKAANQAAVAANEKRNKPQVEFIRGIYARIGELRAEHGISVEELYRAQDRYYVDADDEKQTALENGTRKITADTSLPFGYSFFACDAQKICNVADALHCSIDYLFGKSENVSNSGTGWQHGEPTEIGFYAVVSLYDDSSNPDLHKMMWTGYGWKCGNYEYDPDVDGKILGWLPMPEVSNESYICAMMEDV
ncbi:MAG: ParB N-terminal domain-containing protein [Oscillospiraceae bacterium]|nr:ParB N-terminal domain-containing protein [Oscillospiraceae bacterium]MBR2422032.1 ParB N-terminal domain-containing protein [Oscillospiraceae bacterium]